ncbi:hypothetical protein [Streptomyces sp. NPDC059425]|uniref:hypothetical protein n=1 Tax=Streptomyces sp. NPDC059425 TaxID=3346826 RepID=UPI00369FDDFF
MLGDSSEELKHSSQGSSSEVSIALRDETGDTGPGVENGAAASHGTVAVFRWKSAEVTDCHIQKLSWPSSTSGAVELPVLMGIAAGRRPGPRRRAGRSCRGRIAQP